MMMHLDHLTPIPRCSDVRKGPKTIRGGSETDHSMETEIAVWENVENVENVEMAQPAR
jgi:hypothetical protein